MVREKGEMRWWDGMKKDCMRREDGLKKGYEKWVRWDGNEKMDGFMEEDKRKKK